MNDEGLILLKRFEGFRITEYLCPAGVRTIYWGHAIRPGETFDNTVAEGERVLAFDVSRAESAVRRLVGQPLDEFQLAALVDFTFNLGAGALQASTLRSKLNRGEYGDAANEFPRWVYAGGVKLPGLVLRRYAEQKLFCTNLIDILV